MATYFEVRIADEERTYAAQAAQAALDVVDKVESHLSRFRANSDMAQIARLAPGEKMRLSEPAFACLEIAKKMELVTRGAFSATAAAMQTQTSLPQWHLEPEELAIQCESGRCNSIWALSAKGLRSTGWRSCCVAGIALRFCWLLAVAAFWPAMRQRMPSAGPAAWVTTMRSSDSF